ncbi:amidohydrolase family protein [Granulicella sp. WH15]|uniref:metal-dependent hydrolase family protein n=1 Tax=Granulicella sp. WH15 TaxID=2602070 RepID=UPI0013A543EB|nr:amidohydrolase family protein [Granulicella sp. WH15]
MNRNAAVALALAAILTTGFAFAAEPPSKTLYVRAGKLMTSASDPLKGPTTMIVTDGRISAIGDALPVPQGAEEVDLSKYTVMPGFIDSHIHLWTGPRALGNNVSYGLQTLRAQKAMKYAITSGVVGVRVLGSDGFIDVALADAIDEGTVVGPHVLPAGHAISIPAGHGDSFSYPATIPQDAYYTPLQGFISSTEDAEKAVHLQIKYGAKVIKIMASGGVGSPLDSPTAEQLSPEEMKVIVEQAHMAHLKVSAHDENTTAILDALHAGVDSIEHASELNQEAVDYMKAHHVWWDPTVYIVDSIVLGGETGPDYFVRKGKALAGTHFPSFRLGLKNGMAPQMCAGSDMSYEPGGGTVLDEMMTMVKYGATPQQALVAGTINGAALAGWSDMGTLEVGKEASFVALDGDPTTDISVVKKTKAVVFKGKVVAGVGK